jgi:hypothetical protein
VSGKDPSYTAGEATTAPHEDLTMNVMIFIATGFCLIDDPGMRPDGVAIPRPRCRYGQRTGHDRSAGQQVSNRTNYRPTMDISGRNVRRYRKRSSGRRPLAEERQRRCSRAIQRSKRSPS